MAASLAKLSDKSTAEGRVVTYIVTFDDSFLAAGEIVDISGDFSTIIRAGCEYADAVADHGITYEVVGPVNGTDVSATNVLIVGHWSTDATGALTPVPDTTDNSTTGSLRMTVVGKPLNPSNYQG